MCTFFFFKQKTAYEMRISDWSSDVCSSDLLVYRERGVALDEATLEAAAAADAVLLGAMGLPEVRYPDGREISPQVDLRELWGLFAGVRPIRAIPGAPLPLADPRAGGIDFVLVRAQKIGRASGRERVCPYV